MCTISGMAPVYNEKFDSSKTLASISGFEEIKATLSMTSFSEEISISNLFKLHHPLVPNIEKCLKESDMDSYLLSGPWGRVDHI